MEFSSRGFQRNTSRPTTAGNGASGNPTPDSPNGSPSSRKKAFNKFKGSRIGSLLGGILFISAIILVIAVIFGISSRSSESSYVNSDDYQAVFLEGGQVYFGKLKAMNDNYFNLSDIYYLNVDQNIQPEGQQSQQQNLTLVKLGCELHGPRDQMVINRSQVTFWENLKNDSRVVTAIKEWQSQNKDGQNCDEQNTTTQQQSQGTPTESRGEDASSNRNGSSNSNSSSSNPNTPTNNNGSSNSGSPTTPTNPTSTTPATPTPTPEP